MFVVLSSCSDTQSEPFVPEFGHHEQAIVNGLMVTGDEHLATMMLANKVSEVYGEDAVSIFGEYRLFCSSTLITPNYVLTAEHCVAGDLQGVYVLVGQSEADVRHKYEIEAVETLEEYDIALIKLKTPVPLSIVKPIAPLPPSLAITAEDVDSEAGVTVIDVGFGLTYDSSVKHSEKHKMTSRLYAYCPEVLPQSQYCSRLDIGFAGFMFVNTGYGSHSGICSGDSGGPTFLTRNGIPFVAGVHSFGSQDCASESESDFDGYTIVSDVYDSFIRGFVTDLPVDAPETDCGNGEDDNGDGRIDCDDPWCWHLPACSAEVCDDNIDNDENGATDCEDSACTWAVNCQKEICNDKIDNNGDGLIDCDDPDCDDDPACLPEICHDGIDNNGDGLKDCEDKAACADALNCQPEICDDDIDNNGDGLKDCDDPLCETELHCQSEICDDDIDNNGDGLKDCDDPLCAPRYVCNPYTPEGPITHTESGCSVTVRQTSSRSLGLWMMGLVGLIGLGLRRGRGYFAARRPQK